MGIFRSTNPTEFDDVDGIIINETAPPPSIQGVPVNIAILIGQFERGPENELIGVGSTGQKQELFGAGSFTGDNELKSKRFGRLRLIRVVASDAVKASLVLQDSAPANALKFEALGFGAYGNLIKVVVANASSSVAEQTKIKTVADITDSLDGTTFILQDKNGSVAFWIDTDDSGTVIPAEASGADRAIEITTIITDDSASIVATKIAIAIGADSQFSAVVDTVNDDEVNVTDAVVGARPDADASTSGFTLTELLAGLDAGRKYTIQDTNTTVVLPTEIYDDVLVAGKTQAQIDLIFVASKLIKAIKETPGDKEPINLAATPLASGSDGTVADSDYQTAITVAEQDRAGNVLWLDRYNATLRAALKTHTLNAPDKIVILAGDATTQTKSAAITDAALYRDTEGRIVYAFNPLLASIDGVPNTETSPAGWVASVISNISPHIDPAFSGNAGFVLGATDVKFKLNRGDFIQLKEAGIAAWENDPDIGIKLKSGITTQIANSQKILILRRRMADFLTTSGGRFLKNFQNAPNTLENRNAVKAAILRFIQVNEQNKILPTDAEVQTGNAKLVDTDILNTDDGIADGFFKILWRQRIFSSMRFIVLQAEIGTSVVVTEV